VNPGLLTGVSGLSCPFTDSTQARRDAFIRITFVKISFHTGRAQSNGAEGAGLAQVGGQGEHDDEVPGGFD
jgi:hypothetical protein